MTLRLKMRSDFPADVRASSPITVDKSGGVYTFGLDADALGVPTDAVSLSYIPLPIETLGASPLVSATANTAAIQAALNIGGALTLTVPGTYQINAELQIGDYTDLRLGPGVILQRAANDINMMTTTAMRVTPTTVTLSWTSGMGVTMTWTAHGKSVGDPISVQGADQSYFTGVFLVRTVTNANTLTFQVERLPLTAPTGTIKVRSANRNINITGGVWDFNYPNYTRTSLDSSVFFFGYAFDSHVRQMTARNLSPYTINGGALRSCTVDDVDVLSDLGATVQFYGPLFDCHISNVTGVSGDDGVAFMTREFAVFSPYIWTYGDVLGCTAKKIGVINISIGNTCAAYWSPDEYMDQVHFEDIYGGTATGNGSLLYLDAADDPTSPAGLITLTRARGFSSLPVVRMDHGTLARLKITDTILEGQTTPFNIVSNRTVLLSTTFYDTIDHIEIDGFSIKDGATAFSSPSDIRFLVTLGGGGTFTKTTLKNINFPTSSNIRIVQVDTVATIGTIDFEDCNVVTTESMINVAAGVLGTPNVSFRYCSITANYGYYSGVSATVSFNNCKLEGMANGLVTGDTNGTTQTVYGDGNSTVGGIAKFCNAFANSPKFAVRTTNFTSDTTDTIYSQITGGIEYDGALFYKTPTTAVGRGVDLVEHFRSLYNTATATSSNAAQAWFDSPVGITLAANACYFFEGELFLANGTTSHTTSLLFALSGGLTLTDITYSAVFTPTTGAAAASTTTTSFTEGATVVGAASVVAGAHIRVSGIVRTNVSGKFTPQFQWSANPTGTNQVLFNTWFRLRPFGLQTVTSQGNWT